MEEEEEKGPTAAPLTPVDEVGVDIDVDEDNDDVDENDDDEPDAWGGGGGGVADVARPGGGVEEYSMRTAKGVGGAISLSLLPPLLVLVAVVVVVGAVVLVLVMTEEEERLAVPGGGARSMTQRSPINSVAERVRRLLSRMAAKTAFRFPWYAVVVELPQSAWKPCAGMLLVLILFS